MQERHWFLHRFEEDPLSQNICGVAELVGAFTDEDVTRAVHAVLSAHPEVSLRFFTTPAGLQAAPSAVREDQVRRSDLGDCMADELLRAVRNAQETVLDPESGLTCVGHLVSGAGRRFLCVLAHACVADHASVDVLLRETDRLLSGGEIAARMPWVPRQPAGRDGAMAVQSRYWRSRIDADHPPLLLPEANPRPARKRYDVDRSSVTVAGELARAITEFCERRGCSEQSLFLSVFAAVLGRWSGQPSIVIGRRVDLRPADRPDSVGCFENLVPVSIAIDPGMSFAALAERTDARLREDAAHESFPFELLLREIKVPRDLTRNPLVQIACRISTLDSSGWTSCRRTSETEALERVASPFDLELHVAARESEYRLGLDFDRGIYDAQAMARLLAHCVRLLELALEHPESELDDFELLSDSERREQLEVLNPPMETPRPIAVTDLFAAAVRTNPDARALAWGDVVLSYRQLDVLSDRIADWLHAERVDGQQCVGLCLGRSVEMAAAVLGVLKAGMAYVPMDPAYPVERLQVMAEDSSAPVVLAHRRFLPRLPASVRVLEYEALESRAVTVAAQSVGTPVDPESLAYVIFTSGSTGRPKGVAMPHRALANLIEWQLARSSFKPGARVLQYSSLSFDVSFQELFSTWVSGGCLYLVSDEDRRDPRRLLTVLIDNAIERLFLPYVALRQLVEVATATSRFPVSLEEVVTAGEQLRVDGPLRTFFDRIPNATLDNQYGPSETHVITAHLLTGDRAHWPAFPPIGRPIRGNQAYILDARRRLLPKGATGELYLAGVNLAQGYLGREDLTRERFVANPFGAPGAKMYRTGDLARYDRDGAIEFLGRADTQVKIRGYRIEPGEVDSVIAALPDVKQSLTKVHEDPTLGKRLVTYVLVEDAAGFDVPGATAAAAARLPEYMVPSVVVPLETLPFTPSGKIDMRALPAPDPALPRNELGRIAPRTPQEQTLAEIWRSLLGVAEVGSNENFFELGGDSLKAVTLFLEIERRFGKELPLSVLAEHATIAGLARVIESGDTDELGGYRALRRIQRGDASRRPLFLVHGGGGNVVLFAELARNLGTDLPVYAFQWDGWDGGRGCNSIESMAELYLDEMRRVQPEGPYLLGGHCIGGMVAMEMARRLIATGETLAGPLIATDTPNLAASSYHSREAVPGSADARRMAEVEAELRQLLEQSGTGQAFKQGRAHAAGRRRGRWNQRFVRLLERTHRLVSNAKFPRYAVEQALDRAYVRVLRMAGARIPLDFRGTYAGMAMIDAIRAYRPTRYAGDVLFFRAEVFFGRAIALDGWWEDVYLGFAELCTGALAVHFVDASHDGIVQHPATAAAIRDALKL